MGGDGKKEQEISFQQVHQETDKIVFICFENV